MTRREGSWSGRSLSVLVVAAACPYPATNGSTMRTWGLLRGLALNGHNVRLLAFGNTAGAESHRAEIGRVCQSLEVLPHAVPSLSGRADYAKRLRALGARLPYGVTRFRSDVMRERISTSIRTTGIDVVLCETPYQFVNFPQTVSVPVILDCQNVEHVVLERYMAVERNPIARAYAWVEWWKLRRWERYVCSRADLVLVCSDHDRAAMEDLCPGRPVSVVPNVLDVDHYVATVRGEALTVLYSGGMDWFPNRDAVEFFVSQILPPLRKSVPGVRFVVAGRGPSEAFRRRFVGVPGVEFTGTVPAMTQEIARAAVCVVPLRIASGTRLKILEAAAMAKPIVSTRIGAEGLTFVDGHDIVIADRPTHFAQCVASLLTNPAQRERLGQAARWRVEAQFSFPVLQQAIGKAMTDLAAAATAPRV
jgi:polysaccharide biosynthesis protein PslH